MNFHAKAQSKQRRKELTFAIFAPLREKVLKIKSRLKLHDTSRLRTLRAAEVAAVDVWREEFKWSQIQLVKDIEEVCLDLKKRSFT